MSNIWKSVKLDFSFVRPYVKTICFTMALPAVFAAINRSLLTGISFAMCFIAMTSGYTFSITEKNDMERLYGILPVRKSELVVGRYVFIIMGVLALIFSLITHPDTVFQFPGYYKFGSIKGRVFMYIPVTMMGEEKTPYTLNEVFSRQNVFDAEGNLLWDNLRNTGEYEAEVFGSVTNELLENLLKDGKYPIIRVRMYGLGNFHYILVVKAENGEYYCMDPLRDGLIPLSQYGNRVYAVRCVYPK